MSLLKAVQLQIQPYYIKVTTPFTNHEDCCTLLEDLSFNEAIFFPGLKWPKSNSCFSVQTVLCCILDQERHLVRDILVGFTKDIFVCSATWP